MLFSKEFLSYQDWDKTIETKIISHGRWTVSYEVIFEHKGHAYLTRYTVGATEYQDQGPYEYKPDMIECPEMVRVRKMMDVWEEAADIGPLKNISRDLDDQIQ